MTVVPENPRLSKFFLEYTNNHVKEQEITVIFKSHNLHHVHQIAVRIVAFALGAKVADVVATDTNVEQLIEIIT